MDVFKSVTVCKEAKTKNVSACRRGNIVAEIWAGNLPDTSLNFTTMMGSA